MQIIGETGEFFQVRLEGRTKPAYVAARFIKEPEANTQLDRAAAPLSVSGHLQKGLHPIWLGVMQAAKAIPLRAFLGSMLVGVLSYLIRRGVAFYWRRWYGSASTSAAQKYAPSSPRAVSTRIAVALALLMLSYFVLWGVFRGLIEVLAIVLAVVSILVIFEVVLRAVKTRVGRLSAFLGFASAVSYLLLAAGSTVYDRHIAESILDRTPKEAAVFVFENIAGASRAEALPLERFVGVAELSGSPLKWAIVDIEDERICSRGGAFDYPGIARAALRTATGRTEGGSTIPLQCAKLIQGRTRSRLADKPEQAIIALRLSVLYPSADQQLALYANMVQLCGSHRGLAYCATDLFGVADVRHLRAAEAALLAAMLNNPVHYDPRRHEDRALARRNLVLRKMWEKGHLNEQMYRAATGEPILLKGRATENALIGFAVRTTYAKS